LSSLAAELSGVEDLLPREDLVVVDGDVLEGSPRWLCSKKSAKVGVRL
jgi:hypothetical protein